MDAGINRAFEILSANRAAFELLLQEKRRLRQELVSAYVESNSVWEKLPKDLSKEQRLDLLKAILKKNSDEITQNLDFMDNQLLCILQNADMAEHESSFQKKLTNQNNKYQDKIKNLEREYSEKLSTEIAKRDSDYQKTLYNQSNDYQDKIDSLRQGHAEKLSEEKKNNKRLLNAIIEDLNKTIPNSDFIESITENSLLNRNKKEKEKKMNQLSSNIEAIVHKLKELVKKCD